MTQDIIIDGNKCEAVLVGVSANGSLQLKINGECNIFVNKRNVGLFLRHPEIEWKLYVKEDERGITKFLE